jgi:hypothetical protein
MAMSRINGYRIGMAAVGVLAGLVLAIPAVAAPAPATPALTITVHPNEVAVQADCNSDDPGRFSCTSIISGGVAPYSYHWNKSSANTPTISGACPKGERETVTLTVTDSVGTTGTGTTAYVCTIHE